MGLGPHRCLTQVKPGARRRLDSVVRKWDRLLIVRFCRTKNFLTAGLMGDIGPTRSFSGSAVRDDQRDVIPLFSGSKALHGRYQRVKQ
jgi:hypothetical protein